MGKSRFKLLEELNEEYEKNKWERRKKRKKCNTKNLRDCRLEPPDEGFTYDPSVAAKFFNDK